MELNWIAIVVLWAVCATLYARFLKRRYRGINPKELLELESVLKLREETIAKREVVAVDREKLTSRREEAIRQSQVNFNAIRRENQALSKYKGILRAELEAEKLRKRAIEIANGIAREAQAKARSLVASAKEHASKLVVTAEQRAKELEIQSSIHAESLALMKDSLSQMPDPSIPQRNLWDDLASAYGHIKPGTKLKEAKALSRQLIKNGAAVQSDDPEAERAIRSGRFVIDTFNTKVDATLLKIKSKSHNELKSEMKSHYAAINLNASTLWNVRISSQYLSSRLDELKWAFLLNEHRVKEHEEQKFLRAQEREEEKARREHERAAKEGEKEQARIREAIESARLKTEAREAEFEARLRDQISLGEAERSALIQERDRLIAEQSSELAVMQKRLLEAEDRSKRQLSMAQQTRMGHVYVISNRGSFGDGVYKIGMTRRLDPMDRVRELGDASVPFSFDVHAIIMSNDAPSLESTLHKRFSAMRMNKINLKKEFFKTSIADIKAAVTDLGCDATWTMASEAREYTESLEIDRLDAADPGYWERLTSAAEYGREIEDAEDEELEDA